MNSLSSEFVAKLKNSIEGEVKTDRITRLLYSTDASIHEIEPLGVVYPIHIDELQTIVQIAGQYNIPIIARGSGSGLAGQAIGKGLIVDCSRYLNKIVNINVEERTATVEPGLVLDDLNRVTKKDGLQFGPDPASSERATLGGCIGNNATGAHSIIYGMTADHVISADVVLSDGSTTIMKQVSIDEVNKLVHEESKTTNSIVEKSLYRAALQIRDQYKEDIKKSWPKSWRRVSGYNLNYLLPWSPTHPQQWDINESPYPPLSPDTLNLSQLFTGSEGTLGILRTATLRLVPVKHNTLLSVINFASIYEACAIVPLILELSPSAVELIPQSLIHLARSVPSYANLLSFVVGDPAAMLVVEFSGDNEDLLKEKVSRLNIMRNWSQEPLIASTPQQQKSVWDVRKVGLGILMSRLGDAKPTTFIEDMSVPVEKLGEFVEELDTILKEHHTYADYYGHASVGCLHIRPLLNIKSDHGRAELRAIAEAAVELVLRMGGVVAAEHGDGITRSEWIERAYGPRIMQAIRTIKNAADPKGILNPGKIIDSPRMDTSLRYDDKYHPQGWTPIMAFSAQVAESKRLVEAIEQCNGAGVCRKSAGVMCPSYQATQDEYLSTRGRANLLRAMVSGKFETQGIALQAVKGTLDKCLACKGCRAECPSAVDMAKLKYEFYQHYHSLPGNKRPIRDYLFGYIALIAKFGNQISPLVNWIMQAEIFSGIRVKFLGLSSDRKLPKFSGVSIYRQLEKSFDKYRDPDCLFLLDAFNLYFYPQTTLDAFRVLKESGCNIRYLTTIGTGRTLISKGFLKQARRQAVKLVDEIKNLDPDGLIPIVGLEPSEIYTLKDEFLDFLPNNNYVKDMAERALLVDEFMLRPGRNGLTKISTIKNRSINSLNRTEVLLHGHCYQKAQPLAKDGYPSGVAATKDMLSAVGYGVTVIDDGCCGMAGAFGYEAEHYDLSMKVAELSLLPAVRKSDAVFIAAAGVSCKSQIEDGTDREVYHPISLVARTLEKVGSRQ